MTRIIVLVPAHDEQDRIEACLASIAGAGSPAGMGIETVVVADNCSDATAQRAASPGVLVLVRDEPAEPGKPRAISWALERLDLRGVDAIVIVDADSILSGDFFFGLERSGIARNEAIQGYFATLDESRSWLTLLSGLWARVRYEVQYPRLDRRGLNVPLTGNGMCIGADLLAGGWPSFSLAEDLSMYARWTAEGVRIRYARDAVLWSEEVQSLSHGVGQRLRWSRGRTQALREALASIWRSHAIGPVQKLHATRVLALPGPVTSLTVAIASALAGWVLLPPPWRFAVLAGSTLSMLPTVRDTLIAIRHHPRPVAVVGALARLPVYLVWRLMVTLRSAFGPRNQAWRRTERHPMPPVA